MMNNISGFATKKNIGSNHFEAFFEFATVGILVTSSNEEITAANPFVLKEFTMIAVFVDMLVPIKACV